MGWGRGGGRLPGSVEVFASCQPRTTDGPCDAAPVPIEGFALVQHEDLAATTTVQVRLCVCNGQAQGFPDVW